MKGMHRRLTSTVTLLTAMSLLFGGCTSEASSIGSAKDKGQNVVDSGFTVSAVGSYDSADTAVVLSTDLENKAVSFVNMGTGKQYTLYYDGATYVKDKYDGPMTISQIQAGDVVDVTFLKGRKKLASIKKSPDAWIYDEVRNYDLAGPNKTASIGSVTYALPDGTVVLSEGKRVETAEVMAQDVITISGVEHEIYSVSVDRGHGYLRLKNDQALLGGWIEVGNSVIRQITEDMLLTVPEGSYQVALSNKGASCVKDVTVERNKEVVLDVSDLEIAEDKTGKILFSVNPESAKVSVDGKAVDISQAVELRYGIHQVVVEAAGYDTLSKYIQVGSEYATISFTLEESRRNSGQNSISGNSAGRIPWKDTLDSVSKNSVSSNTVSGNALTTSNNNKVYIDSPKDVEVYVDSNYRGKAPVSFMKIAGKHEIALRKEGYETKSYTIYLDNTKKDETYSFSELNKLIPSGVISAAKSYVGNLSLKNGQDVANNVLKDTKKREIEAAVKAAAGSDYSYVAAYTPTANVADKGTLSVTISRSGYKSEVVSAAKNLGAADGGGSSGENNSSSSSSSTQNPSSDSTKNPSSDSTKNPSSGSTQTPTAWVGFSVTPSDAKITEVRISGIDVDMREKQIYITDIIELARGTYRVRVNAEGFYPYTNDITVEPGVNKNFSFTLNPLPNKATVAFQITPKGATAQIYEAGGGPFKCTVTDGSEVTLPYGKYEVRVEESYETPNPSEIEVKAATVSFEIKLKAKEPPTPEGGGTGGSTGGGSGSGQAGGGDSGGSQAGGGDGGSSQTGSGGGSGSSQTGSGGSGSSQAGGSDSGNSQTGSGGGSNSQTGSGDGGSS